jgi:hypothetical protein
VSDLPLPDDMVAPFTCCDATWFAPLADVIAAAGGHRMLETPCCGVRFVIGDLGKVVFFSKAAWDAADDGGVIDEYSVSSAFLIQP